ncbi:winged helix-turn-helix domain-containing protein [Streptomyces dangxiongensis]|uniref:winged helix-turn-helix domain-containing protein n=1 Tax=Streptomyces dangxiongensis TaxID=1442032 RepID=UPI001969F46C|nr:winged helix-turn-helix domain-containing protein [Streptomyces dangxiongensis]
MDLGDGDQSLLSALARDGRTSRPELAATTNWSDSAVRHPIATLRRTGALNCLVDVPSAALRFRAEARIWMTVQPSQAPWWQRRCRSTPKPHWWS